MKPLRGQLRDKREGKRKWIECKSKREKESFFKDGLLSIFDKLNSIQLNIIISSLNVSYTHFGT